MRSKSRGYIHLQNRDPRRHPRIDPNYMDHEEDWIEFRRCIEISREIFAQSSFDAFRAGELAPGADCKSKEQVCLFN